MATASRFKRKKRARVRSSGAPDLETKTGSSNSKSCRHCPLFFLVSKHELAAVPDLPSEHGRMADGFIWYSAHGHGF